MSTGNLVSSYPIVGTPDAWGEALSRIPDNCGWSEEAERHAVRRFVQTHPVHEDERRQAIQDAVNLFKARLLLRLKCGLPVEELLDEYRPYERIFFRQSGFDRSLRVALGELDKEDVPSLVQALNELLVYGAER